MINLLPHDYKQEYRAARRNIVLRRYVIGLFLTCLVVTVAFGSGYTLTTMARSAAIEERRLNEADVADYTETKQQAETFEANLKTAKTILGNEVIFSQLVIDAAKTLPSGSILTTLNLSRTDIGQEVTLLARAKNDTSIPIQLKEDLEASALFENVSLLSVTRSPGTVTETEADLYINDYPVVVTISVTLSKSVADTGANP